MPPAGSAADRNLLFGILALQMDFITRDQLIAGMNAWVLDKHKALGTILHEQAALDDEQHEALAAMVQVHLKKHANDPEKSLAAVPVSSGVKEQIRSLCHPDIDIDASLGHLASAVSAADAHATAAYSAGLPTSSGLRFQILRPHAEGGLGRVSVAHDQELKREVALKEIKEKHADDPHSRSRFLVEAEITGALEHPGIVPVYGLGTYQDGRPFYAMRFIKGDSLKEAIERFHAKDRRASGREPDVSAGDAEHVGLTPRRSPLTPRRSPDFSGLEFRKLLGRFIDVCNALAYAHSRGVLHRDLKPGNIMLGKYGETLVVDWGLAKAGVRNQGAGVRSQGAGVRNQGSGVRSQGSGGAGVRSDEPEADSPGHPVTLSPGQDEAPLQPSSGDLIETIAGTAVGTPAFMSPEQAEGRLDILGPQSDVYSLGATLYAVLTGRPPFTDRSSADILHKVRRGDFPPPALVTPGLPRPLEAICLKAMALRPAERYASARALADDVERWLADEPVSACREAWTVRAARWARKRRTLVTSAAAVLLVGAVGAIAAAIVVGGLNQRLATANADLQASNRQLDAALSLAEANEAKAKVEAATATAVKDFLKIDLLQLASARAQHGEERRGALKTDPDLKVRDLVLRAAEKIEGKFKDQPLVEAEIRGTVGWTLFEIGRADLAIPQELRVREIYTAKLGPDHPNTLWSMNNLANSYEAAGRSQEALTLREETLKLQKAKLGRDHPDTLGSMNNLANSYFDAGRSQEALHLREETLKLEKAKLGPDHPDTLRSMSNLANSYAAAGRNQEALQLREETLKLQKAKLGPDHPDTLLSMNNLANSYADASRRQEALQLYDETLKFRKAKLGPDHPETLASMNNLARSYAAVGRTQEALQLSEETLKLQKAKLGPDHPETLSSMNNLANSYAAAGRSQEALQLREETLKLRKAKLGPDHPETLSSMSNLANSYAAAGRNQEALQLREETLKLQKAKLGPDHPDTLRSMNNLALSHITLGNANEALTLLRETVERRQRRVQAAPANSREQGYLAWTHGQLGQAEQLRHDFAAARKAYAVSLEMFSKLDQAGTLNYPLFRGRMNFYRQQSALCQQLADLAGREADELQAEPVLAAGLKGRLDAQAPLDISPQTMKSYRHGRALRLKAGQAYRIDVEAGFDPLLRVEDRGFETLAANDDVWPPGDLNSRLVFTPEKDDAYRIVATSVKPGVTGEYTLRLKPAAPIGMARVLKGELKKDSRTDIPVAPGRTGTSDLQGALKGKAFQARQVELAAGRSHVIELQSPAFDTFLILADAGGKMLAANNDVNPRTPRTSRLDVTPKTTTTCTLIVTSFKPGETGPYTLRIQAYGD